MDSDVPGWSESRPGEPGDNPWQENQARPRDHGDRSRESSVEPQRLASFRVQSRVGGKANLNDYLIWDSEGTGGNHQVHEICHLFVAVRLG